jgi:hypothetical protein
MSIFLFHCFVVCLLVMGFFLLSAVQQAILHFYTVCLEFTRFCTSCCQSTWSGIGFDSVQNSIENPHQILIQFLDQIKKRAFGFVIGILLCTLFFR